MQLEISSRSNKSIESDKRDMKKLVLLLLIVPIIPFSWDGLKSNSEIFLFEPTFINSELVLNK